MLSRSQLVHYAKIMYLPADYSKGNESGTEDSGSENGGVTNIDH
jgi:hypothetical protein